MKNIVIYLAFTVLFLIPKKNYSQIYNVENSTSLSISNISLGVTREIAVKNNNSIVIGVRYGLPIYYDLINDEPLGFAPIIRLERRVYLNIDKRMYQNNLHYNAANYISIFAEHQLPYNTTKEKKHCGYSIGVLYGLERRLFKRLAFAFGIGGKIYKLHKETMKTTLNIEININYYFNSTRHRNL